MKVILLQDIPKIGKKYEIKDVASGYAVNSLLPRALAIEATVLNLNNIELKRKHHEDKIKIKSDLLAKNLSSLDGMTIEISAKASDKGHLFSGIHKGHIVKVLIEQKRIEIPKELLDIDKPIKEIGDHPITVRAGDSAFKFVLKIIPIQTARHEDRQKTS